MKKVNKIRTAVLKTEILFFQKEKSLGYQVLAVVSSNPEPNGAHRSSLSANPETFKAFIAPGLYISSSFSAVALEACGPSEPANLIN